MKIPGPARLVQLSWSTVLGPVVGESIELRLFRVRPASNPAGFGYIQLNSTFTIDTTTFTGAGNNVDISDTIIADRCVLTDEYLACSWVHVGGPALRPLNMNWNFEPIGVADPEPSATTTVYSTVFG